MARRDKRWDLNPESLLGEEVEKVRQGPDKKGLECHNEESGFGLETWGTSEGGFRQGIHLTWPAF